MSDVTKILSQCGIIVTLSSVVATQVNPSYLDLDSTGYTDMWFLFDSDEDETAIDIYFVTTIDFDVPNNCGLTTGLTGTPQMSGIAYGAGIAIPDSACDASQTGQEIVRTVAHEIVHYLLNHNPAEVDHLPDLQNLMSPYASDSKRDINLDQCIEMRVNNEVD